MTSFFKKSVWALTLAFTASGVATAQSSSSGNGGIGGISVNGQEYATTTAVPFLRITPNARTGAMGDAGIALQPDSISDPDAAYLNPAKLAYNSKPVGISLSYTPWLKALVNDIYLAQASGYYKINSLQAVAMSVRFFSLGSIQFTNAQGESTGQFKPNEFAIDAHYSRILAKGFSAGIGLRFIYSNLASGQTLQGVNITPGKAASADIAFYYNHPVKLGKVNSNIAVGLNFSNLGSKISYTSSAEKDFIPMNMGIGAAWRIDIDKHNQINFVVDANKLLVPTPTTADNNNNGILDYREKSVPEAIFTSFGDAPGGFKEEMHEVTWQTGIEYWYDKLFAVRAGYFHESETKGNRHFFSAGVGLRYSVFGLDFSYLIPTSTQRNPLDNTLRFSLVFNFNPTKDKDKEKKDAAPADNTKTSMVGGPTSFYAF